MEAVGELRNNEQAALVWLLPEKLPTLDWAEADWPIIADYRRLRDSAFILGAMAMEPISCYSGTKYL